MPGTITHYFHPQQSQPSSSLSSTDTFISPTHLPNTSLPIAITDAVGSSKPHCYMMPLFWDLIES
jgi:hypothetical protein